MKKFLKIMFSLILTFLMLLGNNIVVCADAKWANSTNSGYSDWYIASDPFNIPTGSLTKTVYRYRDVEKFVNVDGPSEGEDIRLMMIYHIDTNKIPVIKKSKFVNNPWGFGPIGSTFEVSRYGECWDSSGCSSLNADKLSNSVYIDNSFAKPIEGSWVLFYGILGQETKASYIDYESAKAGYRTGLTSPGRKDEYVSVDSNSATGKNGEYLTGGKYTELAGNKTYTKGAIVSSNIKLIDGKTFTVYGRNGDTSVYVETRTARPINGIKVDSTHSFFSNAKIKVNDMKLVARTYYGTTNTIPAGGKPDGKAYIKAVWGNWSNYSETKPTETVNREIETAIAYSYPLNFTIRYNANKGSGSMADTSISYYGSGYLRTNGFSRTGYIFAGWSLSQNGNVSLSNGQEISASTVGASAGQVVNIYAQWTPITYTVSFNGNGATSGSMGSVSRTYDKLENLPANQFAKIGYDFVGWNTQPDGSGNSYSDGQNVSNLTSTNGQNVVLYAQWKAISYSVCFNSNGGRLNGSGNYCISAEYDKEYTFKIPEKYGYMFTSWTLTNADNPSNWTTDNITYLPKPYTPGIYDATYRIKNLTAEKNKRITFTANYNQVKYNLYYKDMLYQYEKSPLNYEDTWNGDVAATYQITDNYGNVSYRIGVLPYNVGSNGLYYRLSGGAMNSVNTTQPLYTDISSGIHSKYEPQDGTSGSYIHPIDNSVDKDVEYTKLLNFEAQKELWRKMVNNESYSLSETDVYMFAVFNDLIKPQEVSTTYYVEGSEFNPWYDDGSIHYTNKDITVKYVFYDGFTGIKSIRYKIGSTLIKEQNYNATVDSASNRKAIFTDITNSTIFSKTGESTREMSLTFTWNVAASQNHYIEVEDFAGNVYRKNIVIECIDKTAPFLKDWIFNLCNGSITVNTNQPITLSAGDTQSGVKCIEYTLTYTDEWGNIISNSYKIDGDSGQMVIVPNSSNTVSIDIKVTDIAGNVFETTNCHYANYNKVESEISLVDYDYLFSLYDNQFGRITAQNPITQSKAEEYIEILENDDNNSSVSCLRWLKNRVKTGETELQALEAFMEIFMYNQH